MTDDLTTTEAAIKLRVSVRTLRNWIKDNLIHAYKLNPQTKSVYRIPKKEVERVVGLRDRGKGRTKADRAN